MTFHSARCSGQRCRCRPLDSNDEQREEGVAPGRKRFEFRLPRTTSALWVEVEGQGIYYKATTEVNPACFYLDLSPGEHHLTVLGEKRDPEIGLQTGLQIFEYGAKEGPNWYRSLDLVCGGVARCTKDGMEQWETFQRKLPRGVLDPCGSAMIRGVSFSGTRPERLTREDDDLTVKLTLKVYAFETYQRPGSATCLAPVKNR
jgi:hypothetical protein